MTNKRISKKQNTDNNMAAISPEMRKAQYDIVMRNVHTTHEVDGRRITGSVEVPLSLCYVDERYQKYRSHKKIRALERNWDERKLSPITIVPQPEKYMFNICNGKGRYTVSIKNGRETLPATVLLDAPTDPEERLKFEASFFIGQDLEEEKLRPVEKHPSRLICGDEAAIAIEEIMNKYGIGIYNPSRNKIGVLNSYDYTYSVARVNGRDCLDYIFSILKYANWDKEKDGLGHKYVRTLQTIWEFYPTYREETHDICCEELRATKPELISARAQTAYPEREHRAALALYMQDVICDRLGIADKHFYYDNKKKKLRSAS